ncbi:LemA family protein [Oculatella sp. LEGE 06141]|uniref:LemA family protein n=1 Tax=Oculatella sp. LEGE 06141 TaxID=1828648 RepID=UPI00187DE9A2|nr:LemA family protein [Oculatella sp. LEGE 06141]MBE9177955.1 LemA family protein [Oculatella sp. LEGE 06141]
MTEPRISNDKVPEVFALAARLYTRKQHDQGYALPELLQAGLEADIPPEYVQAALHYLQTIDLQQQLQQQAIERRKKLWMGAIASSVTLLGWLVWTYQSLTAATEKVDFSWQKVENQLRRQADLIPSLIDVTQSSAHPERELAAVLAHTRQSFLAANTRMEKIEAANELARALNRFENYMMQNPLLRSNQVVAGLQYELTDSENQLAAKRNRYNYTVHGYNQQVQSLPKSLVAPILGYEPKPYFDTENARVPVMMP